MESMHDLEILIESEHRLIVLETEREGCFIDGFRRLAKRSGRAYFQWTVTQGLLRLAPDYQAQTINKDINQLFAQIHSTEQAAVFILVDFHHHLNDPVAIRHIKDTLIHSTHHTLVLLSQTIQMPADLKSLATYYKLPLPSTEQLTRLVNDLAVEYLGQTRQKLRVEDKKVTQRLVASLCGLSLQDASRMARHAIFNDGIIDESDMREIAQQKFELLNDENVLSFELDYAELDDIAGFDHLKQWLAVRHRVFSGEVELPGGDIPKGLLLLGMQGCGKSLAAKAVAGAWKVPLLHLDFGTLYNRFYGQTEENLRSALSVAENMQPCVLWLDEIEKGLSAVSTTDDVSKRLLGTFLTWLAEKKQSVFVVATANDIAALPPELLRKGRFDEVFFVDLPTSATRIKILRMHLVKRKQPINGIDFDLLAEKTRGFSGAELEQLVVSALYHRLAPVRADGESTQQNSGDEAGANDEIELTITTENLLEQVHFTRPLSLLMRERILALREWARERAVAV